MGDGYKKIFLGFIFITFHITLGGFKVLPNFIAYMIIYYGIRKVAEDYELKLFELSARFCAILSIMSFFSLVIEVSPGWGIGKNVFFNLIRMNIINVNV